MVVAADYCLNIYNLDLALLNPITLPWQVLTFSISNHIVLLLIQKEQEKSIVFFNPIDLSIILFLPVSFDITNFFRFNTLLITIDSNTLTLHKLSTRTEYNIYNITNIFLQNPYLVIIKEKKSLILYNVETFNTEKIAHLEEEIIDVKLVEFCGKKIVVAMKTSLAVFDEEFNMLNSGFVDEPKKIFVNSESVFVWTQNVILKIDFAGIETGVFTQKIVFISN